MKEERNGMMASKVLATVYRSILLAPIALTVNDLFLSIVKVKDESDLQDQYVLVNKLKAKLCNYEKGEMVLLR